MVNSNAAPFAPVMSPFWLISKLPIIPLLILVLNTSAITPARLPSDFSIASSMTRAACAPRIAYGSTGLPPSLVLKPEMNCSAAPVYLSMPTPATLKYASFAFGVPPSLRLKTESVVKPSGSMSFTAPLFGPSTETLSLISCPEFSSTSPPMKMASGLVALIRVNSARKLGCFGSYAEKPVTVIPSAFAAPWKFLATPRPYASLSFRMYTLLTLCESRNSASTAPWFITGISIAAQPELKVPITPIKLAFCAYACAFRLHLSGSHFDACAVESSHTCSPTLWSPAFQFCWSSRYRAAATIWSVCVRELPCIGKSVAISTSGLPSPLYSTGVQDDAGSADTFPPLLLELLLPPQPAAARARTPMSMASSPMVPYLLKMTPPSPDLWIFPARGAVSGQFGPQSKPEPRDVRVNSMPKVGLEPTRGFP